MPTSRCSRRRPTRTVVRYVAEAAGAEVVIHAPGRSVALLSRIPTREARWHRMARARNFVEVELDEVGIRVLGVHLSAGLSGRGERRRCREIERVLQVAGEPPGAGRSVIAGDLNAIAPGDVGAIARLPAWIRLHAARRRRHRDGGRSAGCSATGTPTPTGGCTRTSSGPRCRRRPRASGSTT